MAKTVVLRKIDGRLTFSEELPYIFSLLANGTYTITVKRSSEKRSINQNALMWMWFTCIERMTGTPKQDVHDYYCAKFLQRKVSYGEQVYTVVGETSKLNTAQMTEFLDKVQADAQTELGITLPTAQDRFFDAFEAEYNY